MVTPRASPQLPLLANGAADNETLEAFLEFADMTDILPVLKDAGFRTFRCVRIADKDDLIETGLKKPDVRAIIVLREEFINEIVVTVTQNQ